MSVKYILTETEGILSIVDTSKPDQLPITIDFASAFQKISRSNFSVKNDPLARALGLDKNKGITILDGTLGFANDALKMLYWGANVIGVEKQPEIFKLLDNAYRRAASEPWINRFQISNLDINDFDFFNNPFDVLYLDPMFFDEDKKAKSKKNIQLLRELVGIVEQYDDLIKRILSLKNNIRVVVKRSLNAEALLLPKSGDIKGKLVRYDIYRSF